MGTSPERSHAPFLSVSGRDSDPRSGADIVGLQLPLMVVVLWPLGVRKECGLGSDTIYSVWTPLRLGHPSSSLSVFV